MTERTFRFSNRLHRVVFTAILAVFAVALPAHAGPERARMSRDLVERLAAGDQSSVRVIVSGTDATIQTLATR